MAADFTNDSKRSHASGANSSLEAGFLGEGLGMTGPFESPKFLIQQTRESLAEFDALCRDLFAPDGYANVTEVDPKTADKTFKIKFTKPLPGRARHIATTAISDLRHALDQAMCIMVTALTGETCDNLYFPFAANPKDLCGRLRPDRFKGLPEEVLTLLKGFEPYPRGKGYPGGNTMLSSLSKAAGPNKHQISCNVLGQVSQIGLDSIQGHLHRKIYLPPRWDMARNELVIGHTGPRGNINYDFELILHIVFENAGVLNGKPVADTIKSLLVIVEDIVLRMEAKTAELSGA